MWGLYILRALLIVLCVTTLEIGCRSHIDCPSQQACINARCSNPCTVANPCTKFEDCHVERHQPVCVKGTALII